MSTIKVDSIQNTSGVNQFDVLNASSGYQKHPGGMIMQWGSQSVAANVTANVTLPVAFPTACLQVIASSDAGTGVSNRVGAALLSASQITLINAAGSAQTVRWFAIGY